MIVRFAVGEVESFDDGSVVLEVGSEVGPRDGISTGKYFKCGFNMRFDDSVG